MRHSQHSTACDNPTRPHRDGSGEGAKVAAKSRVLPEAGDKRCLVWPARSGDIGNSLHFAGHRVNGPRRSLDAELHDLGRLEPETVRTWSGSVGRWPTV